MGIKKRSLIISIFLFLLIPNISSGQDILDNLKNLKGVMVGELINNFNNQNDIILDKHELETKMELKLRLTGIKVYDKKSSDYDPLKIPILILDIQFDEMMYPNNKNKKFYPYNVRLILYEPLKLSRAGIDNYLCVTWTFGKTGLIDESKFIDTMNEMTESLMDEFTNDYLRDNPK